MSTYLGLFYAERLGNHIHCIFVFLHFSCSYLRTFFTVICREVFLSNTILYIILLYRAIGLMNRVFANDPGDRGSIAGRVIPKTQKMVLDATLLSTQHCKVRIKGKRSNPGKGVEPSPTPRCSSY